MRIEPHQNVAGSTSREVKGPLILPQDDATEDVSVSTSDAAPPPASSFSRGLLDTITEVEKARYKDSKPIFLFHEFLEEVERNPLKYLRPISRYVLDAVNYWDKACGVDPDKRIKVLGQEVRPFAFVRKPWEPKELLNTECVQGQLHFWNTIYEKLELIARKKHPNRMILVHGPNATGKSRVFETLFQALEEYSKTDEGALYTYEWVFDRSSHKIGFGASATKDEHGPIQKEKVITSIPAGKNANPIFLLDKESRIALLNELEKQGRIPRDFNKDYIIANGMNDLSSRIYEALWKHYKGDIVSVFSHVHVVRWTFSAQGRRGLVLIQPEVTPNTRLVPITPEINWDTLPMEITNAFRTAGLHMMEGDEANANHGVIVFDDIFKDAAASSVSINDFLYLLRFAEKATTTVSTVATKGRGAHAIDEQFDTLLFATTNDDTLTDLQERYPEWESLKSRLDFNPLWFERCYRAVTEIFRNQLRELVPPEGKRHISPNVLETFGLWLTMTYLFPSTNEKYYGSLDINPAVRGRLLALLKKMTVLEKALLYQDEDLNSFRIDSNRPKYTPEETEILERHTGDIANEYNLGVGKHKFFFYEGSIGLPSRMAEPILERAVNSKPDECFSVLELFDIIEDEIKHGFEFEEKRRTFLETTSKRLDEMRKGNKIASDSILGQLSLPTPPHTKDLLNDVKEHERRRVRFDIHEAIGCIRARDKQIHTLNKYVQHARAFIAKKAVKAGWEDPEHESAPNEKFMEKMETIFNPSKGVSSKAEFRGKIAERIGDWVQQSGNKGKDPMSYTQDLFPDLLEKMTAHDIKLNEERVRHFLLDLRTYYERGGEIISHNMTELEPERAQALEEGLKNLRQKGYCDKCIPKLIYFAFPPSTEAYLPSIDPVTPIR